MDMYDVNLWLSQEFGRTVGWVEAHPDRALTLGVVGVVAVWVIHQKAKDITAYWRRRSFFKAMGKEMTAEDRRQYLDSKAADVLTDWQIDQWARNKMSWQEVKSQCKRLGLALPLRDLLPVKNHPMAIRHRVEKAIEAMKRTPKQLLTAATSVAEVTKAASSNVVPLAKARGFRKLKRGKAAA